MAAEPAPTRQFSVSSFVPAFFRDIRVLHIVGQIVFAVILIAAVSAIWTSILASLQSKNLTPNTGFLTNRSGFDISERPSWYSSDSSYADAFRVGVENSLRIISIGLVLTTILGIFGGIFLLSTNWLIRTITRVMVEILRNTPLLVQLIAWYFVVMLSLPLFQEAITVPQEGILPLSVRFIIYAIVIVGVWLYTRNDLADRPRRALLRNGLIACIVVIEIGFHWAGDVYASRRLDNPLALLYFMISAALLVAVWSNTRSALRWRLLGLTGGQLLGGILFYFGILPNNWLAKVEVYPSLLLSKRGLVLPEILPTARFNGWLLLVVIGLVLGGALWFYWGRITETTGRTTRRALIVPLLIIAFVLGGWAIVSLQPAPDTITVKQKDGTTANMTIQEASAAGLLTRADEQAYSRAPLLYIPPVQKISPAGIVSGLQSGAQVTPEYMALLVGLVVYTAAFIAEIVRAGILAVPHGQLEAARALGFSTSQTLSMIIMPQALRVIIPPLGNQYLNLSKNSSLAIAVAFADLVLVTQTIMNQSGQSVTGITMIMLTYLVISLLISAAVNVANRRFQVVTR
jgi:His/Glu/Gln/Arg/opine family amino acid ABC transporter permease subunit